jgi:hypothetical protein
VRQGCRSTSPPRPQISLSGVMSPGRVPPPGLRRPLIAMPTKSESASLRVARRYAETEAVRVLIAVSARSPPLWSWRGWRGCGLSGHSFGGQQQKSRRHDPTGEDDAAVLVGPAESAESLVRRRSQAFTTASDPMTDSLLQIHISKYDGTLARGICSLNGDGIFASSGTVTTATKAA